jgi:hypothetical protein
MNRVILFLAFIASAARAQDSAYSELRVRLSVFRNPVAGEIVNDWHPGTGGQIEVGTPLPRGELHAAVGHLAYTPTTGKPPYTATLFTIGWMAPKVAMARLSLAGGARLTDYRMDFDDPSLVGGLRTEEEVLLSGIGRASVPLGRRFAVFADVTYGVLMLGRRTPMLLVHGGVERVFTTPEWVRALLR